MSSGISKWVCRDIPQEVCPWNVKFARVNRVSEFQLRVVLAWNDARAIARGVLAMSQPEFSSAFTASPMKRAKLRGLKRNAAVVLGNLQTASHAETVEVLTRALDDPEPLVREHVAWALRQLAIRECPDVMPPSAVPSL